MVEAVRHARTVNGEIRKLTTMDENELYTYAKTIGAPIDLVQQTAKLGRLPVVNFAAGGVATPADAALMMQLGTFSIVLVDVDEALTGPHTHTHTHDTLRVARDGRSVRGFGHLQERQPGQASASNRAGSDPLQGPARAGQGVRGPGRGHGGNQL